MMRTSLNSRRSRPSCSVIALATVLAVGATPAAAQSFQGEGNFAHGSGSITTGTGTTDISVGSPQAVIDWVPDDNLVGNFGAINFQPSGTTATFNGTEGNYAVLNRINVADPSRMIAMSGTINSRIGGEVTGGSIYFYSPSGFVLGGTSVINVGSLVLTSRPVSVDGNGNFLNNGTVVFGAAADPFGNEVNPNAGIVTASDVSGTSQINALNEGSYVAMVAPRVQHGGNINVNGSAALVGAEAATITFRTSGLFDIQVDVGSDARDQEGNVLDPISVTGDIGGETPTGDADQHRVYLVAVPKNEAMTMVISQGANLGFELAGEASIDANGAVVLSAGHDIVNGQIGSESAGSGAAANFWFTGAHATNNLFGEATGYADLYSINGTPGQLTTTFDSDVTVHADEHVWMSASGAGTSLTVGGGVHLSTDDVADFGGGSAQGGHTSLYAQDGGSVTVLGSALLTANGVGGSTESFGADGGDGTGGFVEILALSGGNLQLGGLLTAKADGIGGDAFNGGNGGAGNGGANGETQGGVSLRVDNATMAIGSTVELEAKGYGGRGSGAGNAGGTGTGGDVLVQTDGAGAELTLNGDVQLDASGVAYDYKYDYDFDSADGGDGIGGTAQILANGGLIDLFGSTDVIADGIGGHVIGGGDGGTGTGGWAEMAANGGAGINAIDVLIQADGTGGDSFNFFEGAPGDGGDAFGGRTGVRANDGSIHITGGLEMDATSTGGTGANGGDATGVVTPSTNEGLPSAAMIWAGSATAEVRVDGLTDVDVGATGGAGSDGNGGNAAAGEIDIVAQHGDVLLLGNVIGNANALGGDGGFGGGSGGTAAGGAIDVTWALNQETGLSGTIAMALPDPEQPQAPSETVVLSANGTGGNGGEGVFSPEGTGGTGGAGGNGTGGGVSYVGSAGGGTFNVGSTSITANGNGGNGGNGGSGQVGGNGGVGGIGTGGFIQTGTISNELSINSGGTATFTVLTASASATGGAGGNGGEGGSGLGLGGDGGDAFGGEASFLIRGIEGTADTVSLFANATGGDAGTGSASGNGGDAATGVVAVESKDRFGHPTQRGSLIADTITGTATAEGGSGAVAGTSTVTGSSYFRVLNGDADIGTLTMMFAGDEYDGTFGPDYILAQDGSALIGNFTYDTTGELAVFTTSTGSIDATDMTQSAGNFVDYPFEGTLPAPGSLSATNLSVTSGGDFIAHANFDIVNEIDILVPGSIRFGNAESGSFVNLWAQGGSINIGNVDASNSVTLTADTFLTGGNVNAGGSISAVADGGNISLGSLTSTFGSIAVDAIGDVVLSGDALADGDIEIDATGLIDMQNAQAGESVDLVAGGNVTALNLTGGDSVLVQAGGSVDVGNLSAGLVDPSINEGAEHEVRVVGGGNILAGNIAALGHIGLAAPGTITALDINAGGIFMALAHGDMSFGDAIASEVFLSDYATLNIGGLTATCIGACGSLGADGVVTAPPTGPTYAYVTTDGGETGAGQLPGQEQSDTNGSVYTTSEFEVAAGEALDFWFNYVTSDGSGFADYAWAALLNPNLEPVAMLYTARTQPDGTIVPGQGLPGVEATLDPSSVPIIDGGPVWSPLGADSGSCFGPGCGYTGWVSSSYEIADAGTYILQFGVTNWDDTGLQSGMAFSGLTIGGVSLTPTLLTRTGGSISIGNVETGKFAAAAGTNLTTGIIDSSGSITLDAGGAVLTENLSAGTFVQANGGSITTGVIDSGGSISLGAGSAIVTENLFAGDFVLANGGSITTANIEAESVDMTSTGGNITVNGDIFASGAVELDASGNMLTGDVTAASIDLIAGGDMTTDDLTTQFLVLAEQFGTITPMLFPGASITLESGGDIVTGNIDSIDGVYANAGGSITTLAVEANSFVELLAVDSISTGDITAFSQINLESSGGGITTQDLLSTDGDIDLDAFGNISFASGDAGTEFDFSAGGAVDGGNVVAGNQISGDAGGIVELGDLTVDGALVEGEPFSIGIVAAGDMSVGNVSGAHGVGLATFGDLNTGNINAGDLFMALVGGDTTIDGSVTTTGEDGGQVYIANASMCEAGGECDPDGEGDFIPAAVLALDPVPTGGSITINGPVTTGAIRAAAGTNFIANAITAPGIFNEVTFLGGIDVSAGGTAAVNGLWSADGVRITSNDINITQTGAIDAFGVELISTNAERTVVGDGVDLPGYNLSDAEYDRISGGVIHVAADASQGANPLMIVGDLSVEHNGEGGEYSFSTGNGDIETGSGTIRVVGDALFSNMEFSDVYFTTGTFQLDAETATLALTGAGSELAGELGIEASNIHVASGAILDQLAEDPQYDGYQQDLNGPAEVQRPDGVVRAASITLDFEGSETATLYVQNTGTAETPAGFLVSEEIFVGEDEELSMPPGSIDLIINGQIQTEGGTLTGIDVRDAMVEAQEGDLAPFTANSTINGCSLTGACGAPPPPPPPPSPPPPEGNVIDSFIDLLGSDPLGDGGFGNEPDIADNQEGEEDGDSPISPPQPLFDTRPLIPSGDVNDPVSGTGNPALLGSDATQCEETENGQCPANPVKGDR